MFKLAFKKPENMKYTDMCIYIDKTVYKDSLTEEEEALIYQYIYHVCYVLACKGKYFRDFKDYNEFALFAAGKVYMRLVDPRQFEDIPGERKLDLVKSVLNYIKLTLYGMKVDYQKQTFRQIIDPALDSRINSDAISNSMKENIRYQYRDQLEEAIFETIETLPSIIRKIVSQTPYKNDIILRKRIYISCLISFLKSITLSNANAERLRKREERASFNENYITKIYQEEKENSITLWRLDKSMHDYIQVLCNKIRKEFSRELIETKNSFELTDEVMEAILMSAHEANNTGDDHIDEY